MVECMALCVHLGVGLIYCKLPRKNSALNTCNLSIVSLYRMGKRELPKT